MFSRLQKINYRLRFVERDDPGRARMEQHIHDVYAQAYEADVKDFMPVLIALEDPDGALHGVMGLRSAGCEPLLLEHYLDHPIERVISTRSGRIVARDKIVELGNLAAGSPGAARVLVMALSAYLQGADFEWVSFTAVPTLRNVFRRLDLRLIELARANPSRLGASVRDWGRYYESNPVVVAGDVRYGFSRLNTLIEQEQAQSLLGQLWYQALAQGRQCVRRCA
jgi:hypothetical protein